MNFEPITKPKQIEKHNIIDFLEFIQQYDTVVSGQCHCLVCGRHITPENFSTAAPVEATLALCCNNERCNKQFSQY